jgi:glycine betaine catabolism A
MNHSHIHTLLHARQVGHSLPQDVYLKPEMLDFDMAAIYQRSWLMAGMECELPESGNYLALQIGKWPIILVRGRDGVVRGFHNSCRHRGSILCEAGRGSAPKLVCPYHRWTYNLDGALFAAGKVADKENYALLPIQVRCVAGAIFVCLTDTPPDFTEFETAFKTYTAPYNLHDMKCAAESTLVEYANWKLVMENARECYHCSTGHPELAKSFPVNMASPHDNVAGNGRDPDYARAMEAMGVSHEALEREWWQIGRLAMNPGNLTISMDGQYVVKKLLVEPPAGVSFGSLRWALDPHLFAHATADYVIVFSAMPVGPAETHVHTRWYVHKDAVEGQDYTVEELTDLWTRTNLQDKGLAERNHQGVQSLGYTPGPYAADAETLVIRFADWYCEKALSYIDAQAASA